MPSAPPPTGTPERLAAAPAVEQPTLLDDADWERFLGLRAVSDDGESATTSQRPAPTLGRRPVTPANVRRGWTVARTIVLLCADALSAVIAVGIARGARSDALPQQVSTSDTSLALSYAAVGVLLVFAWVAALAFVGAHHKRRFASLWDQGAAILRASVGLLALIGVASLFTRVQLSRTYVASATIALVVLTFAGRCATSAVFQLLMRLGILMDRVLLIGPERQVAEIRRHLERTSSSRVRVVTEICTDRIAPLDTHSILDLARQRGLTSVLVCGQSALPTGVLRRLGTLLSGSGVNLVVAPGTTEALGPALEMHPIGDLVLLRVSNSEPGILDRFLKVAIDTVGSICALIIGAPIILGVAIAVALDGRPVLFRQTRIGRRGRPFRIYKFRTMAVDAEERLHRDGLYERYVANGFKLPADEDPRITRLGRFLRRTSLDELPQLFNVLRGQMSLVGPRPVVEKELECYGELMSAYTGVKPGVTGYWQINGRSDVGFPERGELDAYYYDHRSLRFDLRILARTAVTVLLRRGAH